jgi:malonyl-CoA/methylmalonyl-CoA synthetase
VLIRDTATGIEVTSAQFLRDIVFFQDRISIQLATNVVSAHDVAGHGEVYICILAPLSYEFLVAFYAVIALGAVAVPLCMAFIISSHTCHRLIKRQLQVSSLKKVHGF